MVTAIITVLLGVLYLIIALTRPFTFTWKPASHVARSAVPFGLQVFFSFFSPVAFALGLDNVSYFPLV
jgi:formate-dependent nitrite reductase membrane component NrfD